MLKKRDNSNEQYWLSTPVIPFRKAPSKIRLLQKSDIAKLIIKKKLKPKYKSNFWKMRKGRTVTYNGGSFW